MEFCPKEIVAVIVDVEEFCMSEVGFFQIFFYNVFYVPT